MLTRAPSELSVLPELSELSELSELFGLFEAPELPGDLLTSILELQETITKLSKKIDR